MKRLTRSSTNRQIAGVCGGLADYFAVDPTLVRVFTVVGTVLTGFFPGILAYIALIVIMPTSGEPPAVSDE